MSAVTGADGYLTASYRYNAYGEMTFGKPQYENVYGYNGESYNPNLNGQYLRARYYNVGNANFFTEDSYLGDSREPLSLNRYNYAHSNPENYRDPSGQFVLTLSSLAITAGVGAITGVIFSVLDQYTTEGKIEAGRTIKAAFYGATGAVIGVGAGAVVGTALTGIGMGATFSSTVMMGAVDGMITGTAVRANTELLDHAFANFERDRAKLSGTVLDEVPKKTWQESVSRILDPKSTATDAIAGGIAGGLFYMANAAMLKNQVQQCAEGEIAKNASLNTRFKEDTIMEGERAFEKINIEDVYVKPKHLASTHGNGAKFSAETKAKAEMEVKEALKRKTIKYIEYDGISVQDKQKYKVYLDAGKPIGTRGEKDIMLVVSEDGGILSVYPTKK